MFFEFWQNQNSKTQSDEAKFAADKKEVENKLDSYATLSSSTSVKLITNATYGSIVTYSSSNPDVLKIEDDGTITINPPADNDEVVTITYTTSLNGQLERGFKNVTVKKAGSAEETSKTLKLDFSSLDNRTSLSDSQQVWEQNGVKLVNDKALSTNKIVDYSNPARFYKSSKITISCNDGKIKEIKFICYTAAYATALESSITDDDSYTILVNDKTVTITFKSSINLFEIASLSAQVRMDSIEISVE